jgi:anti-sigma regulatory factor (Ser/Thr protein kinase)
MIAALSHQDQAFVHEAFLYRDSAEFLQGVTAFLREGIEAGEPILVVLSAEKIEQLRSALGPDAEFVSFADMAQVGANPARIIAAWRQFVDDNEGRPLRGIGEPIWASRSAPALAECHRHESLLNVAFADTPAFRLLCPYDVGALHGDVVEEAQRTHPYVSDVRSTRTSGDYRGLDAITEPFAEPLPEAPAHAIELRFDADNLAEVRGLVLERAEVAGLAPGRAKNLVLAVNEIATNSVRHAGGGGIVRVWDAGDSLVCQVEDRGRIEDPLVGRRRPVLEQPDGRGVWLANQFCDLVQVRTFGDGNTVRMHMARG